MQEFYKKSPFTALTQNLVTAHWVEEEVDTLEEQTTKLKVIRWPVVITDDKEELPEINLPEGIDLRQITNEEANQGFVFIPEDTYNLANFIHPNILLNTGPYGGTILNIILEYRRRLGEMGKDFIMDRFCFSRTARQIIILPKIS